MILKHFSPDNLEGKFFELMQKVVESKGLELYDIEYKPTSGLLRVFIKHPQSFSATLDDCVAVDKAFDPYCESETWIPDNLVLEVSSPGVYRELNWHQHFQQACGQRISLKVDSKFDLTEEKFPGLPRYLRGQKRLVGMLQDVGNETIVFRPERPESTANGHKAKTVEEEFFLNLNFSDIHKANLEPNLLT